MNKAHKKGFTLVEVIVVVIITGILAAIAGSKLFGSIAKAKASELTVNAGTYVKLVNAAIHEKSAIGTWSKIGYAAPGANGQTKNFKYCEGQISEADVDIKDLGEGMIGWEAVNTSKLNHCAKYNWWTITIAEDKDKQLLFSHVVSSPKCAHIAREFTSGNTSGVNCPVAGAEEAKKELTPSDVGYTVTMGTSRPGGWAYSGNSFNETVSSNQYSTYNANSEDGLFELQPNSTYEYTIEVSEDLWDETKGKFFQTVTRVYSEYDKGVATILCGSSLNKAENDPGSVGYTSDQGGSNGYNTGNKDAKAAGYTAEANMEHVTKEDGSKVVVTTVTITTGNSTGHFGANFLSAGGWTNAQRTEAQEAITNSTLTLVNKNDKSANSSSSK